MRVLQGASKRRQTLSELPFALVNGTSPKGLTPFRNLNQQIPGHLELDRSGRMRHDFEFRNPPRWARMCAVGFAVSLPGAVAGGIVALWVGHPVICMVAGALIAAIAGATVER